MKQRYRSDTNRNARCVAYFDLKIIQETEIYRLLPLI